MKSSLVVPNGKLTLLGTVWTMKTYNSDRFRAQLKSIWKTKKKFEIKISSLNLFMIEFEEEEDLELILVERSWLFRRNLVIFKKLEKPIDKSNLCLVKSPFWLKIGPCPPECDKKDLTHATQDR
ncbi:hypothetical protein Gotri_004639 [Gossypium trilobum]|uniref:DUF4283 domain-containing protein n=1 Tax=Gossypium trilobum TaxID=34281 RepID=A0A7J9F5V9_9ROSI|nr:hypothetical protein [Gossypium trilobum]